jgi:hypothetical protein
MTRLPVIRAHRDPRARRSLGLVLAVFVAGALAGYLATVIGGAL